jgi:hypothetical protein
MTFVAVKKGFTAASASAAQYTGEVYAASIGVVPDEKWKNVRLKSS